MKTLTCIKLCKTPVCCCYFENFFMEWFIKMGIIMIIITVKLWNNRYNNTIRLFIDIMMMSLASKKSYFLFYYVCVPFYSNFLDIIIKLNRYSCILIWHDSFVHKGWRQVMFPNFLLSSLLWGHCYWYDSMVWKQRFTGMVSVR